MFCIMAATLGKLGRAYPAIILLGGRSETQNPPREGLQLLTGVIC